MATTLPSRPSEAVAPLSFGVVASRYHEAFVDGLVAHFRREIEALAPGSAISVHHVPGAFEIPVLAQEVALRGGVDVLVAFGVIIEGETAHAALIGGAVTDGLQRIALAHRLPAIHEVLLVKSEAQARARCLGEELNRGTEAARVAVRMAEAMRGIRR